MGKTNIDALVATAAEAWSKTDTGAETGRVLAVLPLVRHKVPQATFTKGAGLSSSTVSRYYRAAGYALKHGATMPEIREHAADLVRAQKPKGGPEALDKSEDKSTLFATAARLAVQNKVDANKGKAKRAPRSSKSERQSIAAEATALRQRIEATAGDKASEALTNRDMEALSALVAVIAGIESVQSAVRKPRQSRAA